MTPLIDEEHLHATNEFKELNSELYSAYKAFHSAVFKGQTSLDVKTKELIAVAVGAALDCVYCIDSHAQKAFANGAL